jgi:SNF2 family DNA or RNA helicase
MRSKDYLVLPQRIENTIEIGFDEDLKKMYRKFSHEKVLELYDGQITAQNAAGLTNKLLQFTSGAIYNELGDWKAVHSKKIEALQELIEELQGEPVIVFYQFKSEVERIKEAIPIAKHLDEINLDDWDKGLVPVLLAHPKSAGHGLNLQAGGHTIIWFSPTWSLEQYTQANARLDRQGQDKSVEIHHLIVTHSIDEIVMEVIKGKGQGQEALLNALITQVTGGF